MSPRPRGAPRAVGWLSSGSAGEPSRTATRSRPASRPLRRTWSCPDGKFTWRAGGVRIRSDGLHLTQQGYAGTSRRGWARNLQAWLSVVHTPEL